MIGGKGHVFLDIFSKALVDIAAIILGGHEKNLF